MNENLAFALDYSKYANHILGDLIEDGRKKFILYPFGERGKLVKSILNIYYGLQEYAIVDQFLSQRYPLIKSLADLKRMDLQDVTVLITSDREESYDEIREALYQTVPRKQCVELFPRVPWLYLPKPMHVTDKEHNLWYHMAWLAAQQSSEYILQRFPNQARGFLNKTSLIEHLIFEGVIDDHLGMFLEFGVYQGNSINFMATMKPLKTFYGFDAFQGLPEHWFTGDSKGAFDLNGQMPRVLQNVQLIKGWFDETLPKFLSEHQEKCAFIHMDCDLYSSTKTVLSSLKDRIVAGTVIEFDEYFNYPKWQEHEYKAFQEFIQENGIEYEYLGYIYHGTQAAIKILSV